MFEKVELYCYGFRLFYYTNLFQFSVLSPWGNLFKRNQDKLDLLLTYFWWLCLQVFFMCVCVCVWLAAIVSPLLCI